MNRFALKPELKQVTRNVLHALAFMCIATPIISQAQTAIDVGTVSSSGNGSAQSAPVPEAAKIAVSQASLDARSAQSIVSDDYVRNFTSPVSDFSQVFMITPGAFSVSTNGVGMGNAATNIRGLTDSQYDITFDGIPFNDTNGVSHHSYLFFPAQAIGGAVVDRSPGDAATIGQATFGGSLNLLSRNLDAQESSSVTGSYGSWSTGLLDIQHQSGNFGQDGAQSFMFDLQRMESDGYETYNYQYRNAFSAKYRYIVSPDTVITAVTSLMDVHNNQPNAGAPTVSQVLSFGPSYLDSNNPALPNYYGYNFYIVQTEFTYVGITSNLGGGWKVDDKVYNYGYHNQENYDGSTLPTSTVNNKADDNGVDKLNSYHTFGNILRVSKDFDSGTLNLGIWNELANSDRHQIPQNPLTLQDGPTPNFSETYQTLTTQPYVEYTFKIGDALTITPGVKFAEYEQDYVHLADLKKVLSLGGTLNKTTNVITGGDGSIANSVQYHDVLPSLDAHYKIQQNWTTYAQWAAGDLIPPTTVFDVPFAQTTTVPVPTKSSTFQIGTVWQSDGFAMDADVYHVKLANSYNCVTNTTTDDTICSATGDEVTQGFEVEGTVPLGAGFSIYANGTVGTTKYSGGGALNGMWVSGAPSDTEGLGLMYKNDGWNAAWITKRVGKAYNDNSNVVGSDSYVINPWTLSNLFVNYTIKNPTQTFKDIKLQLAVNNLFDSHAITAIGGNGGADSNAPSGSYAKLAAGDTLTLLPGRSAALTATFDF